VKRASAAILGVMCLLAACSKHKDTSKTTTPPAAQTTQHVDPCAGGAILGETVQENPVPLLCAAGKLLPDGEALCDSIFGVDWATFDPPDLADASTADRIAAGIDSLCTRLHNMSSIEANDAAAHLKAWVDTYLAVAPIENTAPEAFGTGTAYVKELADLLPGDIAMRAASKKETGDSMATAEFTELMYGITTRLSGMEPSERNRVLEELKTRVAQAAKHP
jgi:hypothetical protein